jgi:hypothetical protein
LFQDCWCLQASSFQIQSNTVKHPSAEWRLPS